MSRPTLVSLIKLIVLLGMAVLLLYIAGGLAFVVLASPIIALAWWLIG